MYVCLAMPPVLANKLKLAKHSPKISQGGSTACKESGSDVTDVSIGSGGSDTARFIGGRE